MKEKGFTLNMLYFRMLVDAMVLLRIIMVL
jgi:hypothetical protein